ncbi:peptide deformylase [Brachybacterium sp. NPDC056505]|uniref:peptide deformylase n=1 Tax=Brachybacterium sp. NPDC056505 TaxID=3345843 RepID=UPI00366D062E
MDLTEYVQRLLDRRSRPEEPLRIVQAGHPALRGPVRDARDRLDPALLRALVDAMVVTMREAPGVGLAATQIGVPLRLFVAEDRYAAADQDPEDDLLERRPFPLRAVLDPDYEILGEQRVYAWEGCLSYDGLSSIVPRGRRIRFTGALLQPDGALVDVDEEHQGWSARILQHETDHLAGTLCHDLAVPRSIIDTRYAPRWADVTEAVDGLGLTGPIERLAPGTVVLD